MSGAASAASVAPPSPYFSARMLRDAPIGAVISIVIGFVLLFVKESTMPGLNLNSWMITALASIDPDIGMYAGALLNVPTLNDPTTPLWMFQYAYASFLSFPSILAWVVGGFIVSFLRIKKGRDEGNLKAGWDVFWYGLLAVEIPFALFGVMFLIFSVTPFAYDMQGFTGSILLYFLLFFLQPMFWLGLFCSLFGSWLGAILAKKNI